MRVTSLAERFRPADAFFSMATAATDSDSSFETDIVEEFATNAIGPYMYEPYDDSAVSEESESEGHADIGADIGRLQNVEWYEAHSVSDSSHAGAANT